MGLQEDKAKPKEKLSLIFLWMCTVSFIISADGYILKNCYISRDTAICAKNKLKAIPQDLPKTLTGYDLSLNLIMRIQQSDFQNLPVLIWLDLKHNNISQIDRAAFSSLISLQRLNLNYNRLDILGENVFDGLSSLTELRLTSNHLKIVASTSFKSLTSLTFLDLSYNKLGKMRNIRLILQHLPKLQTLVLTKNNLKTFRSWELTNHSLELNAIDICQNYLNELNISDNVFPNLTSFNIGGFNSKKPMIWDVRNKTFLSQVSRLDISGLPMALDSMKALFGAVNSSLTILRMNGMKLNLNALINISCSVPTMSMLQFKQNNLKHVHSDFFKSCIYVTELDLTKNSIQKIDEDAFRSLLSLKTLILSQNALVLVPSATRNLRFLTKLDLTSNKISTLNCDDFTNQTKLIELNLKNNLITALKDCFFKDLVRLQILRLQTNQITRLNDAFKLYLPNLRRLHLNNNKLPKIVSKEFKGLQSLRNLSLNDNQIEKLYWNSFVGLTNLTELLLVSNCITTKGLEAFNVLINLRRLDLSNNKIHYPKEDITRAPFSKLFNLKELSIPGQHHRDKSHLPVNFLQGLTNLLLFSARNSQLLSLHKDTFIYTPNLEKLDISSNDLRTLSSEMFSPLANLRSLYISTTLLKSLSFFVNANLTKLEFLQARKNHYSVITEKVIKSLPSLEYLDFMGNSFACDCYNAFFLNWLETNNTTQVFDAYNFECNYPDGLKDKKLLDLDFKSCLVDINFILFVTTSCLILSFMVATFTYHFMRWQLVYAYYILLAWLLDTKQKNKQTPNQYDAFISYNTHDEPWVIGELLPKLEEEQGWKLCLHHRDFEPGKPIIENITDAIYGSRKTICVISHRYLESEWCSREIQTASFRLFDEQKDVLILVFLEEIPTYLLSPYHRMRKLLKKKTYLSWTQAGEKPVFVQPVCNLRKKVLAMLTFVTKVVTYNQLAGVHCPNLMKYPLLSVIT